MSGYASATSASNTPAMRHLCIDSLAPCRQSMQRIDDIADGAHQLERLGLYPLSAQRFEPHPQVHRINAVDTQVVTQPGSGHDPFGFDAESFHQNIHEALEYFVFGHEGILANEVSACVAR